MSSTRTLISMRRFDTGAELDTALAERLERAIGLPNTAIMLAGGRTPLPTYREVAVRQPVPAEGLHVLFSDERHVATDSECSNFFQSHCLIEALGLPEESVLRVRTELTLQQAAEDYQQRLSAMLQSGVRITLGLLGIGADGHTASLFNTIQLDQARGRLAIAVERPDGLQGVSVTPELLAQVEEPLFLVAGADKHAIVEEFLRGDPPVLARRAIAHNPRAEVWVAA